MICVITYLAMLCCQSYLASYIILGPLDELITRGLNALRECLPGDAELTSQVMND